MKEEDLENFVAWLLIGIELIVGLWCVYVAMAM
jgi:hypothetical protein